MHGTATAAAVLVVVVVVVIVVVVVVVVVVHLGGGAGAGAKGITRSCPFSRCCEQNCWLTVQSTCCLCNTLLWQHDPVHQDQHLTLFFGPVLVDPERLANWMQSKRGLWWCHRWQSRS